MNRRKPLLAYNKGGELPPELRQYQDHWTLFQHRVLSRRWLRYTDPLTHSFTILKREYIERELGWEAAAKILGWGLNTGSIVSNNYYVEKRQSFGYRLSDTLEATPTTRTQVTDSGLLRRIREREQRDYRNYTKAHRHLKSWLKQLTLSCGAELTALEFSQTEEERRANLGAVTMLRDGTFDFGVCDFGRVHTNVTRLFRPIRRHLQLEGQSLVNIDIANSQPLHLANLLLPLPPNPSPIRSSNSKIFSCNTFVPDGLMNNSNLPKTPLAPGNLDSYLRACEAGVLYHEMMTGIGWQGNKDEFKDKVWFAFLYGSNKSDRSLSREDRIDLKRLYEFFASKYPAVHQHMWARKEEDYRQLAREMQRAESRLMIDGVGGRLAQEHPEIPIISIHDSYMTTKEHTETVKTLMMEEFGKLNVKPTLSVTDYTDYTNTLTEAA